MMSINVNHYLFIQVGSLISVFLLKFLGRKYTIITAGALFSVAFLCIGKHIENGKYYLVFFNFTGLSNIVNSHAMVLVFRVMTGCACGISFPAVR